MDPEYYKKIGFMCGLEIHQRLQTEEKLFCSCHTEIKDKGHEIAMIQRRQRAVAGELGKVDKSAEIEEGKERLFTYEVFRENTCLVDIDEEPPHTMNMDALETTISLAHSMGMKVVEEMQPMRKAVVDGSDPSAFQRTVLVALEGRIEVNGHKIGVPSLFLEEESSGIVESDQGNVVYDTSRLGVPLIEIDTDPTIPSPKMAKEVALYLGTLLRITGRVQRGIGSIRQDVNMSIKGGARVEIKGMQELSLMDKFIENEINRQQNLIEISKELQKAKARVGEPVELTKIFKGTTAKIVGSAECVVGARLSGFERLIGREINPQRRLGTEISDYAKLGGAKGIIHSDEDLKRYNLSQEEINTIRGELDIGAEDAFVLIAGSRQMAFKSMEHALWRADHAIRGVPKETRGAIPGELCTSKFLRPLPGGSRMYPETDTRPILVTKAMLTAARKAAPDLDSEKKGLGSMVKNEAVAAQLLLSPRLKLFKLVVQESKVDPELVANILIQKFTELKREGIDCDAISEGKIVDLFDEYHKGRITKQAIDPVLRELIKGGSVEAAIAKLGLRRLSGRELKSIVSKEKGKSKEETLRNVMSKYRLVVDGKELNDALAGKSK
ncbi:MAG: Glu-tRNA(Gln) amidotransferase subunit GatE [Candidatus Micrarchaeota archaeon]|nr:Glu-tRNA(Gln) amidotransferase subunit GatE [Candidatus Micrarchaeota archaeon]